MKNTFTKVCALLMALSYQSTFCFAAEPKNAGGGSSMGVAAGAIGEEDSEETFAESKEEVSPFKRIGRNFETIPDDFARITLGPIEHPWYSALLFGGSALLILFDKPLTTFIQQTITPMVAGFTVGTILDTPFTQGADGVLLGVVAAWYLGSLVSNHGKGQLAAIWATKSIVYSYIYTHLILKSLFGRNRPDPNLGSDSDPRPGYTKNPFDFFHVHQPYFQEKTEGTSFPSFHYTFFYTVARAFDKAYNSWIPYVIATIGILANFRHHNHWASDSYAGVVIGCGIASVVANNYMEAEREENNFGKEVSSQPRRQAPQIFTAMDDDRLLVFYRMEL